ncbi:MAG: TadE-like protein, partial [Actinomycetota bacterium]|nr:TadE-like protein [Actinomycetota bacterium]
MSRQGHSGQGHSGQGHFGWGPVGPGRGMDQRGSSIVEMAIVLPLFVALLLGIFSGGTAYFQKISVVDAAREGARYGASLRSDSAAGGLATWRQNVIDRIVQVSGGQLKAA